MKNVLTKDQINYRNAILKKKVVPRKPKKVVVQGPIPRIQYMNNCMYWINECHYKRVSAEDHLLSAATSLKNYCQEIINEQTATTKSGK